MPITTAVISRMISQTTTTSFPENSNDFTFTEVAYKLYLLQFREWENETFLNAFF